MEDKISKTMFVCCQFACGVYLISLGYKDHPNLFWFGIGMIARAYWDAP